MIFDFISEADQCTGQLVVIDILDILLSPEHPVILERLPPALDAIVSRIEKNAVAVQMRIESARSVVMKHGARDIAGFPIRKTSGTTHTGCGELFQLPPSR